MIKLNHYYRHYKGGIYKTLLLGTCTETNQYLVIYSKLNDINKIWVRPLFIFEEEVIPGVKRFSLIEEDKNVGSEY